MKIKNRLIMFISLYIAIPFFIFASIAIYIVHNTSLDREKEHFTKNTDNINLEISNYLSHIETSSHLFTENSLISYQDNNKTQLLETFYNDLEEKLEHIILTDEKGNVSALYPKTPLYSTNLFNKLWIKEIKTNKQASSNYKLYSEHNGHPSILLIDPIVIDNLFSGAMVFEISYDKLRDIIESRGYESYLYILTNNEGRVIFSNKKLPSLYPGFIQDIDFKNNEMTDVEYAGEDYYIISSQLSNLPYTLYAMAPHSKFIKPFEQLQIEFILWFIFSMISLITIGYFSKASIVEPIEKLVKLTKNVTQGNLTINNKEIEIKNKGELSELSNNFNIMIDALKTREEVAYQRRNNLIQTLVELIEFNDTYTAGHSYRVYRYSSIIAKRLNIEEKEIHVIETAAMLHDIGKIGIPQNILLKEEKLTNYEFDTIKKHPILGSEVLKKIDNFDTICMAILHHHEFYNGNGYPYGIKAEDIPIESRIISVADAFDAMTSNRPYRKGMDIHTAFTIIKQESGKQFDPKIVKVFSDLYHNEKEMIKNIQDEQQLKNFLFAVK